MLHLSRTAGESIMIGQDIKVTVVEIQGYFARLHFDTPNDVFVKYDITDVIEDRHAKKDFFLASSKKYFGPSVVILGEGNRADIKIYAHSISIDNVRLGIDAPLEIPVHTMGTYLSIQYEELGKDFYPSL